MWVLIDRVGHLAYYFLTKISGFNRSNTDTQEVKHFSTAKIVEAEISSPPTAIDGWSAYGWTEDSQSTTPSTGNTGKITMSGDKTIYAIYKRDATFYSGQNKASSKQVTQYYNTTNRYSLHTLPESQVTSIASFTPKGWVTDSGADAAFDTTYTGSAKIFYAKYERNAEFYHNLNNSALINATQTYTSDNKYSIVAPAISKAADIGNSWKAVQWLQKDDTAYVSGGSTYTGFRNVFYAVYSRTLTINYEANGGTGETQSTTGLQNYNSSGDISPSGLSLAENTFTRTGYNFSKWDLGKVGDAVSFAVGDAASKSAKAEWSGYTYTVTYKQGSASSGYSTANYPDQTGTYPTPITLHTNDMTKSDTEKSGSKITVTFNANGGNVSPTSSTSHIPIGYTKNGWTKTSGSQDRDYANGASYTNSESDKSVLTLYPCFTQSEKTRTGITMPTPSKTNYTCTGWWTASSGGSKAFSCGVNYTNITKSQTVYAQWTNAAKNFSFSNVVGGGATTAKKPDGAVTLYRKTVYNVTFSILAGKTWQQIADDGNLKYPTAFSGKTYSTGSVNNPTSFSYTTRAALQADTTSSNCYIGVGTRENWDGNVVFFNGHMAKCNSSNLYRPSQQDEQVFCSTNKTNTSGAAIPSNPVRPTETVAAATRYYMTSGDNTSAGNTTIGNLVFR